MNLEDLINGFKYYNETYPHWNIGYQSWRKRGGNYWLHLESLDESHIRHHVLRFLNEWLCRVSYDSASSLKLALEKSANLYLALTDESLVTIDFDAIKNVDGQSLSNAQIIEKIMRNFQEVQPKFGTVPASKLMHMAIPDLFVMWDTDIKKKYKIPSYYSSNHALSYVEFLKLAQLQINHAIIDCMNKNNINRQDAILHIKESDDNLTLSRILDKYNFGIRDGKLETCIQCFKR